MGILLHNITLRIIIIADRYTHNNAVFVNKIAFFLKIIVLIIINISCVVRTRTALKKKVYTELLAN